MQVRLRVFMSDSVKRWKERCVLVFVSGDDDDGVGVQGRSRNGHGQPFTDRSAVFGVFGELQDSCRPPSVSYFGKRKGMGSNVPES